MNKLLKAATMLAAGVFLWATLFPSDAATIDEAIRQIVREEVAAALKVPPPPVITAPPVVTPPVVVPVAPPVAAGPNPFIACKADSLTLYDCILQRLTGRWGGTAAEWDQAVAAGYERENPLQRAGGVGPPGFPPGFDLTGSEGGNGVRNLLQPGNVYTFSWRAPRSGPANWQFEVNPTPDGATATRVAFNGVWRGVPEWTRIDFTAIAGTVHTLTVQLDGRATVAITVRYGN